jgi:RimJ/RimL family protein N-acetyltransferase
MTELTTSRLLLRQWRESDKTPFARMNADPEVMEHFPSVMTIEQSDDFVDRMYTHLAKHGWGLWAVEVLATGEFIGFVGLWPIGFDPFRQREQREIGWRLKRSAWGHGYASEAAATTLEYAFAHLGWPEVVSFTAVGNVRSQAVMTRIGMVRDPSSDFDHPRAPEGHPVRPHVVYRIAAPEPVLGTESTS